jgi:hypothetical protein
MNGTLILAGNNSTIAYTGILRVGPECRLAKLCKRARDLRELKGAKGF